MLPAAQVRRRLQLAGASVLLWQLTHVQSFVDAGRSMLRSNSHAEVVERRQQISETATPSFANKPFIEAELRSGALAKAAVEERGGGSSWDAATALIAQSCCVELEYADAWVAKAYAWALWINAGRPEALESRLQQPDPTEVMRSLEWLAAGPMQLSAEQMRDVIAATPQVALRHPEENFKAAEAVAPPQLRSDFRAAVLADPSVLERVWDCEGACSARCAQCWRPTRYR
mmetsp:Transcript_23750/g.43667  ORF Transcript_23750/g.43667 Transcript_23750/m.43667 type:complete len:230 (+) Transcript_23750:67-756(+)